MEGDPAAEVDPKELDPEQAENGAGALDQEALEETTQSTDQKLDSAAQEGRMEEEENIRQERQAGILEAMKDTFTKQGLDPAKADATVKQWDSTVKDLLSDSEPGKLGEKLAKLSQDLNSGDFYNESGTSLADQKGVHKMYNDTYKAFSDKFRAKYGKMASSFDWEKFDNQREAAWKTFGDGFNDAMKEPDENARNQKIEDATKQLSDSLSDSFKDIMDEFNKEGSDVRNKGIEDNGGSSSKWDALLKLVGVLFLLGSIFGLLVLLMIMGGSDNGCYMFKGGGTSDPDDKSTGAGGPEGGIGPLSGSKKPKVFGAFGGGTVDGDCVGISGIAVGKEIDSQSCGCQSDTSVQPGTQAGQAGNQDTLTASCKTEAGPSGDDDNVFPFCCEGQAAQYPLCTVPFGPKGTVYYRWYQIPPSDILSQMVNGLGHLADEGAGWLEDILKNLWKNLGPLKYIVWAFFGIVGLWILFELGSVMFKISEGHHDEEHE